MRAFGLILVFVVGLGAGAAGYLWGYPQIVMAEVMDRISERGTMRHVWRAGPRTGPDSRVIVRPSPDLSYAACVYDLSEGPVRIQVAPWDDYWSLSLYALDTDNFWTANDRDYPDGLTIDLMPPGFGEETASAPGIIQVQSETTAGVALIRRLAPDAGRHAQAVALLEGDRCTTDRTPRVDL